MYVLLQDNLVEGPNVTRLIDGSLNMIERPVASTWRGLNKIKTDWHKIFSLTFLGITACATAAAALMQCSMSTTEQEIIEQAPYKIEKTSPGEDTSNRP